MNKRARHGIDIFNRIKYSPTRRKYAESQGPQGAKEPGTTSEGFRSWTNLEIGLPPSGQH